jgi:hypothetical protein
VQLEQDTLSEWKGMEAGMFMMVDPRSELDPYQGG